MPGAERATVSGPLRLLIVLDTGVVLATAEVVEADTRFPVRQQVTEHHHDARDAQEKSHEQSCVLEVTQDEETDRNAVGTPERRIGS